MPQSLRRTTAALVGSLCLAACAQVQRTRPDGVAVAPVPKGGSVLQGRAPAAAAPVPPLPSTAVRDTLQRINAYRAAGATCGTRRFEPAAPVAWNSLLAQAAQKHARDMAARRAMSHTGSDGSSMSERVAREAYDFSTLGENVSAGYTSVPDALAGWMRSAGHCANMMSPNFREVGVGGAVASTSASVSAKGDTYGWYRAMVLGSRAR